MITVGRMAERYGLLPHEVESRATTYDFMITDVLATYDKYQSAKSKGLPDPSVYNFSQDQLQEMVARNKNE
jgi:hypothetical protein